MARLFERGATKDMKEYQRRYRELRFRRRCPKGHLMSQRNTIYTNGRPGQRQVRRCKRCVCQYLRNWRAKHPDYDAVNKKRNRVLHALWKELAAQATEGRVNEVESL